MVREIAKGNIDPISLKKFKLRPEIITQVIKSPFYSQKSPLSSQECRNSGELDKFIEQEEKEINDYFSQEEKGMKKVKKKSKSKSKKRPKKNKSKMKFEKKRSKQLDL